MRTLKTFKQLKQLNLFSDTAESIQAGMQSTLISDTQTVASCGSSEPPQMPQSKYPLITPPEADKNYGLLVDDVTDWP